MKLANRLFKFLTFSEKLKKMERYKGQFYWKDYPVLPRYESVSDHSWRLSLMVLAFEKRLSRKINIAKALKMAIIHDLPEIIAGDDSPMGKDGTGKNTHAYSQDAKKRRHQNELKAAKKLFSMLPKDEAQELIELWQEIEEMTSFEAQVVVALDKIEAMLQVLEYRDGSMFKDHLKFTTEYGSKYADVDPAIKEYAKSISDKMKKKFIEYSI